MRKRQYIVLAALLIVVVAVPWLVLPPHDPPFRGKPESYWVEHLSYRDEQQVKQWRGFGTEGVRVLVRGLGHAQRPWWDRIYRKGYRQLGSLLPDALMRFLPAPRMDLTRGTRMKVVDLLSRLSKDAKLAVPAMGRAVKDEDPSVRQIAITFFTEGEDRNALLNQMETSAKRRLLPEFIGTMQDADPGVRNNATIALRYYPEQAQIVVPVLVKALNDPVPRVRELVAEALNQVAPEVVVTAGVVRVAIGILNDPDDQIAYRAARLLGQMRKEPALTVPALIESMHGSNGLVAAEAASALGNFPDQANVIVPVLLKVYQDTNSVVPRWATAGALKRIDSTAAGKAGAK